MTRIYFFQKYILVFLLVSTQFAINFRLTTDVFEFPKLLVLIVGVGLLTLLNVLDIFLNSPQIFRERFSFGKIPKEFWFLGLFFVTQIIAYIFSLSREISLLGADMRFQGFLTQIHYIFLVLNTFYFFSRWPFEKTRSVFRWLLVLLFAICAFALLPYVFPMTFPFYFFTPAFFGDRVFSTFGNPNYLAVFLIGVLPFLIFCMKFRQKCPFIYWSFLGFVFLTLFLTGSRSAWASALFVFLFFGVIFLLKKRQWKIFITAFFILLGVFLAAGLQNYFFSTIPQFSRLSFDTQKSFSIQTRFHLWKAGFRMSLDRPLTGFGQDTVRGNIEPYLPEYLKSNEVFFIDRVHSEPIDILVTTGIFGFIGYVGFFGLILFLSTRLISTSGFDFSFEYFASVIGIFSVFVFHTVNFSTISSNFILYFLAGYLLAKNSRDTFSSLDAGDAG